MLLSLRREGLARAGMTGVSWLLCFTLNADGQSKDSARLLFYESNPATSSSHASAPCTVSGASEARKASLGLRYSILQRTANGRWKVVDPDRVFREGDKIRLLVESNQPALLYVVHGGSDGGWEVLIPGPEEDRMTNCLQPNEVRTIPESAFEFDARPGIERLALILVRDRAIPRDQLIPMARSEAGKGTGPAGTSSRNLKFAKVVEDPDEPTSPTVYVAEGAENRAAFVSAVIVLRHQ